MKLFSVKVKSKDDADALWVVARSSSSALIWGDRRAARMSVLSGVTWGVHSVSEISSVEGVKGGSWKISLSETGPLERR